VGQVELMGAWSCAFAGQGLHIAQIPLTRDNFGDQIRALNMRNTLFTLVDEGVIPVIRQCGYFICFGDRDIMAL
jgi:glutamate 5-kinase